MKFHVSLFNEKIIRKLNFLTLLLFIDYPYGIRLSQRVDQKVLVTFNARNEHDRCKFAEDLKEAVSEMDEMENLRIEAELERQKSNRGTRTGKNFCFITMEILSYGSINESNE